MKNDRNNPEARGKQKRLESVDAGMKLSVRQPPRLQSLMTLLSDLESISERIGEDRSQDLGAGAAGGAQAGATAGGGDTSSARDRALQSLPPVPVMRQRITRHLQHEMRSLERRARRLSRLTRKGSAYALNELYAHIRKIQALIAELVEAAAEIIRGLYIRLFIDHQKII